MIAKSVVQIGRDSPFADFKIRIPTGEFEMVHRCVLGVRSQHLCEAIEHGLSELTLHGDHNTPDVLELFVEGIYSQLDVKEMRKKISKEEHFEALVNLFSLYGIKISFDWNIERLIDRYCDLKWFMKMNPEKKQKFLNIADDISGLSLEHMIVDHCVDDDVLEWLRDVPSDPLHAETGTALAHFTRKRAFDLSSSPVKIFPLLQGIIRDRDVLNSMTNEQIHAYRDDAEFYIYMITGLDEVRFAEYWSQYYTEENRSRRSYKILEQVKDALNGSVDFVKICKKLGDQSNISKYNYRLQYYSIACNILMWRNTEVFSDPGIVKMINFVGSVLNANMKMQITNEECKDATHIGGFLSIFYGKVPKFY